MILDGLYREVVLDHHKHPRGRHDLVRVDGAADGVNPSCGDSLTVELQLDGERVVDVAVRGQGCAISTASGSMLAEELPGKTLDEVRALAEAFRGMLHGDDPPDDLDVGELEALGGVRQFPVRIKCALLAWTTLDEALRAAGEGRGAGGVVSTEEGASRV